jgi:hypothetical protein
MPLTAERLHDILGSQTNFYDLFVIRALERILEELNPAALDEILEEMLPTTINSQLVMFGHKLGDYMGLDRSTIKEKFTKPDGSALSDADVDDIFAAAGITTGTSIPGPVGSGPAKAQAMKQEAEHKEKAENKPAAAPKSAAEPSKANETKGDAKKSQ